MVSQDVGSVANAFVSQYYNVLYQRPQDAHKFYTESSVLTWPGTDGDVMTSSTTLSGINDKILSSVYKDFTVEIKTIDSQASHDGGVIVAVTGAFVDEDNVKSTFFQTFFLAKQEKGFFVLNDILRVCDPCGPVENASIKDSYVGGNVCDGPPPSLPTKAAGESDISVVSSDTVAKGPVVGSASNGHVPSVVEPVSSPNAPSVIDPALSTDVASVVAPASSAIAPPVIDLALNAQGASVAVPAASAAVPPVCESASEANLSSVSVPSVAKPSPNISYASMVAKLVPVNSPRSAPITPKASSPLANGLSKPSAPPSKLVHKLPNGNSVPDTTRARPESRAVYVGNLPEDITKHGVADALKKFGAIRRYSDAIQIRKYEDGYCCAFVEFESGESASRAVQAHRVKFGEKEAYIALKKGSYNRGGARSPTRGEHRNTNGNQSGHEKSGSQPSRSPTRGGYRNGNGNQSGHKKSGQASDSQPSRSPTRDGYRNGFENQSGHDKADQARGSQPNRSSVQGAR